MSHTVIEKIIGRHTADPVTPGGVVWLNIDVRTARDFGGANVVKNLKTEYTDNRVADNEKTFFTFDCVVPANTLPYANNQQICRDFARQERIRVFDVDMGIGTHVLMEKGLALPGRVVVGTDSHMNILGAIGAFGQGMGDQDIAFAFKTGKTWFEVPETVRVDVQGRYSPPTSGKDLTLAILKVLKTEKALGKCIEFYGESITGLSLHERVTLASMATEMGAIASFMPMSEEVLDFCRGRAGGEDFEIFEADPDADYSEKITINVKGLTPQISLPGKPDDVKDVEEVAGTDIGSVFLGSCTNGRFEDFRVVAEMLSGRKVAENVMVKAVPATREVYGQMVEQGTLKDLFQAGVIVSNPGCGGCASGQIGMTGKGEVQVSTSNRNFAGKQGAGDTYLVAPATAAASALKGRITDPREL